MSYTCLSLDGVWPFDLISKLFRTYARNSRYLSDPYPKITSNSLFTSRTPILKTTHDSLRMNNNFFQAIFNNLMVFCFYNKPLILFLRTRFQDYPNLCLLNYNFKTPPTINSFLICSPLHFFWGGEGWYTKILLNYMLGGVITLSRTE